MHQRFPRMRRLARLLPSARRAQDMQQAKTKLTRLALLKRALYERQARERKIPIVRRRDPIKPLERIAQMEIHLAVGLALASIGVPEKNREEMSRRLARLPWGGDERGKIDTASFIWEGVPPRKVKKFLREFYAYHHTLMIATHPEREAIRRETPKRWAKEWAEREFGFRNWFR